jgi:outer membrane protein
MKIKAIYTLALTLLLISLTTSRSSAQHSPKMLTLNDCIRMGIDSATQVLYGKNTVQLSGVAVMNAYGQFLPDLGLTANYTYNGGKNLLTTSTPTLIDSRQNILNYQLISSINLFNGFYDYAALKAATIAKSASEMNLSRVKQQISFDITQSYLQLILDRRIATFAQENLNASIQREAQLKALTDVGRKAPSDLYQQQAQTSSDKLFMIQTEQKVKNDKILLLRKIRISQPDDYELADAAQDTTLPGPQYQNIDDLLSKAQKQRPDLQASELNIKVIDWNIKQYKSGYLPKLNLNYGLISNGGYLDRLYINGVNGLNTPQEPLGKALFGQVYGTIGLGMSWKVFDKFVTKHNLESGRLYRSNAELARDDLSLQISADIRQAYNDYVSAIQQIETAEKGLIAAHQAYDVIKGRYDIGAANYIEVTNAQAALLQAEVNKAQNLIKLSLQKKVIDYLVGN